MWAQLWNVYHFGKDVETPNELDFCWPTDNVERYYQTKIYHNAGVMNDHQHLFYKGKYVNKVPFKDSFKHVDKIKLLSNMLKRLRRLFKWLSMK